MLSEVPSAGSYGKSGSQAIWSNLETPKISQILNGGPLEQRGLALGRRLSPNG
jgi:hypothetical protein